VDVQFSEDNEMDLIQLLKKTLEEILEEASDQCCLNCENSWDIVTTMASAALELIEESYDDPLPF